MSQNGVQPDGTAGQGYWQAYEGAGAAPQYDAGAYGANGAAGVADASGVAGTPDVAAAAPQYDGAAYAPGTYEVPLAYAYAAPYDAQAGGYQTQMAPAPVQDPQPVPQPASVYAYDPQPQAPWPGTPSPAPWPAPAPSPAPGPSPSPMPAPSPVPRVAAPGAAPVPAPAAAKRVRRGASPLGIVLAFIAGVLVTLIVGDIVLTNAGFGQFDPAKPVMEYMWLIEDGDFAQAAAMADPGLGDAEKALMRDGILTLTHRMTDSRITHVERTGFGAYDVTVAYQVADALFTDTVSLHRTGVTPYVSWTFDRSLLGAVYVPDDTGVTFSVAGHKVSHADAYSAAGHPSRDGVGWMALAAYPGEYGITIGYGGAGRVSFGPGITAQEIVSANSLTVPVLPKYGYIK